MAKAQKSSLVWNEVKAASIGAAVGGILAMLLTPTTGKQARAKVVKTTRKAVKSVKKVAKATKAK